MRRIGDVRCITIVHPLHEIRKYRECSGFFRLLGIFVCENILGKEYGDPTDYQVHFSAGVDDDPAVDPLKVINDMVAANVLTPSMGTVFQKLYDVFSTNDLMRASYAVAYFFNAKNPYIYAWMYEYYDCFSRAYSTFAEQEKTVDDPEALKYIWAAKSTCKRRMNELYTQIWEALEKGWYTKDEQAKDQLKKKLWDRHFFSYGEVNEDIRKILDYDPDFYGAYVIRGFALELDPKHRFDSAADLLRAVSCIGKKSYASYIYYRIGKYYESIRGNLSRKWEYYQESWQLDPNNYRALYKLCLREKAVGNLERAEELCDKLLGILQDKKTSPALQTVECAYLYKTYSLLGDIHMKRAGEPGLVSESIKQSELRYSISCYQKAEEVFKMKNNEEKEKGFYPWMFGTVRICPEDMSERKRESGLKNAPDQKENPESKDMAERWTFFKKAARDKLVIKSIYRRIANAAADAGMKDLYETYYPRTLAETEDKMR